MKSILTILSICFSSLLFAQNTFTIEGLITNENGEPIEFSNVLLFSSSDSTMVKGAATNEKGSYLISSVEAGKYWLSARYIGYNESNSEVFDLSENITKNISFGSAAVELSEIEVKAQRQLIEVQPDKMVFNVDGSINATGNTALELLRKSPGVIVDNNENIILAGKQGVQVYIDDKPTYMSAEDLAIRLNAMQSSEIDAIEIITEPSAKYDAEGNAGIINIRLKKDKSLGANASMNLGYAYGVNHRYEGGLSVNYRNNRANVFASYNHKNGSSSNWMDFYRLQNGQVFELRTDMLHKGPNNSAKLGTDFFINDKHTIGFLVNGYFNERNSVTESSTLISEFESADPISVLLSGSNDENERKNLNTNINYQFKASDKSSINVDLDYGIFQNVGVTSQPNRYTSPDETTTISEANFASNQNTDIDIYTAKLDYERTLEKGKIETGVKHATVLTTNDYDFFNVINNENIVNEDLSNEFNYKEIVNAVYTNYNRPLNQKTKINAGLRLEHTTSVGDLITLLSTQNETVDTAYLSLFPSLGISYQLNQMNQLKLGYNKRIGRPNYQDLNPFEYRLSELSYRTGNAFLRPNISHNLSFTHTYKYTLNTTLTYTYTKDFSTYLIDTVEVIKTFLLPYNLDNQQVVNLGISYPVSPKNWWNTFTSINTYYKRNYALLESGREVEVDALVGSLYHQSTFLLPKDFSFELSGWASTPSIWGADYETEANWSMDAGIKKKMFGGKGNLKVAFTDIFHSAPWHGEQRFDDSYYTSGDGGWESQQIRLNFNYLFGSNEVKESRKRKTGLESEAKRLKSEQ